jgi:two-component system chemotaxis response regulator CheB
MTELIVIGGSAGGLEPLRTIAGGLPPGLPAAVLVVIHTSPAGPSLLPRILSKAGALPAIHPVDGERFEMGTIYVAPPDYHLTVEGESVRVTRGPKFNGHRPAIDALFQSAAAEAGAHVTSVLLSGMDSDGAMGMKAIAEAGGRTIVQSPDDATFPYMVKRAMGVVRPDLVLPARSIAAALSEGLVREPDVASSVQNDISPPRVDAMEEDDIESRDKVPTPYSCPECGGVLWQDASGQSYAYECRVGHVFALDGLLTEQTQGIEKALWMGLRSLEEKQSLLRRLAGETANRGLDRASRRFSEAAEELEEPAETFRLLLSDNGLFKIPQTELDPSAERD